MILADEESITRWLASRTIWSVEVFEVLPASKQAKIITLFAFRGIFLKYNKKSSVDDTGRQRKQASIIKWLGSRTIWSVGEFETLLAAKTSHGGHHTVRLLRHAKEVVGRWYCAQSKHHKMNCPSDDVKCWGARDSTCGQKAKVITLFAGKTGIGKTIGWWSASKGRDKTFVRQTLDSFEEMECLYGLCWTFRCHLELNWTWLN